MHRFMRNNNNEKKSDDTRRRKKKKTNKDYYNTVPTTGHRSGNTHVYDPSTQAVYRVSMRVSARIFVCI